MYLIKSVYHSPILITTDEELLAYIRGIFLPLELYAGSDGNLFQATPIFNEWIHITKVIYDTMKCKIDFMLNANLQYATCHLSDYLTNDTSKHRILQDALITQFRVEPVELQYH